MGWFEVPDSNDTKFWNRPLVWVKEFDLPILTNTLKISMREPKSAKRYGIEDVTIFSR